MQAAFGSSALDPVSRFRSPVLGTSTACRRADRRGVVDGVKQLASRGLAEVPRTAIWRTIRFDNGAQVGDTGFRPFS